MILKKKSTFILSLALLFSFAVVVSCSESEKQEPGESEKTVQSENQQIGPDLESLSDSLKTIRIELDVETLRQASPGDEITIEQTEGDEVYTLIVRRAQEVMGGLFSIAADINERENGLASLVIDEEGIVRGSMQFYRDNRSYSVIYSEDFEGYYLQELDEVILDGSAPLEDPEY
jgi:hypothetical protein